VHLLFLTGWCFLILLAFAALGSSCSHRKACVFDLAACPTRLAPKALRVSHEGSPKDPELFLCDTLGASVSVGTVSANISEICVVDELPIDFLRVG
jgi:hypothetical protein